MVTVGALSRLEVKPGNEAIIEHALQETFSRVQLEPAATAWFACRLGPSTFSIFDVFPDEAGLRAHLSDKVRARMEKVNGLLVQPRTVEKLHVLATKLPAQGANGGGQGDTITVTVGFLSRFEAKPGK